MTRPYGVYYAPAASDIPERCKTFRTSANGLEKRCSNCHEWLPADTDFFTRHQVRPGGLANQCKRCAVANQAATRSRADPGATSITAAMARLASIPWLGTQPRHATTFGALP